VSSDPDRRRRRATWDYSDFTAAGGGDSPHRASTGSLTDAGRPAQRAKGATMPRSLAAAGSGRRPARRQRPALLKPRPARTTRHRQPGINEANACRLSHSPR
jgi:hypothetical protein